LSPRAAAHAEGVVSAAAAVLLTAAQAAAAMAGLAGRGAGSAAIEGA
jgi:hypothetical protein